MPYTLTGIIVPGRPIRVPPKPAPFMPTPAQKMPVGLSVWWRPVAVGFPNTGVSASYIGPRPFAPSLHVGASNTALLKDYFPALQGKKLYLGANTPSMVTAFGVGANYSQPSERNCRTPKLMAMQTPAGPRAQLSRVHPVVQGDVIATGAGLVRLPKNVWLNPMSPAYMV